jgi:enoyl-CoA hydratase/carnithine racemase
VPTAPDVSPERLAAAGLRLTLQGPVARVALARPGRHNAQTPQMWAALRDVGRALPGDVRVVVVSGDGPSFSSGLDTSLLVGGGAPEPLAGLDDAGREAAWAEVAAALREYEGPDGFVGPCELLVGAGTS